MKQLISAMSINPLYRICLGSAVGVFVAGKVLWWLVQAAG